MIASGSDDKTVKLWDRQSGDCIQTLKEPSGYINHVAFHPSGTCVAAASSDSSVRVWDCRMKRKLLQHYTAHTAPVNCLSFHESGNYLISASDDSTLKILDLLEGRLFYTLHGHQACILFEGPATAVSFSLKGDYFASGGADEQVLVWKTNFDQVNYEEVLKSHKGKQTTESTKPTIHDIPPRSSNYSKRPLSSSNADDLMKGDGIRTTVTDVHVPTTLRNGDREDSAVYPLTSDVSDVQETVEDGLERTNSSNAPGRTIQVPAEISSTLEHMVKQMEILTDTVSILERRMTIVEDKLKECGTNQENIMMQILVHGNCSHCKYGTCVNAKCSCYGFVYGWRCDQVKGYLVLEGYEYVQYDKTLKDKTLSECLEYCEIEHFAGVIFTTTECHFINRITLEDVTETYPSSNNLLLIYLNHPKVFHPSQSSTLSIQYLYASIGCDQRYYSNLHIDESLWLSKNEMKIKNDLIDIAVEKTFLCPMAALGSTTNLAQYKSTTSGEFYNFDHSYRAVDGVTLTLKIYNGCTTILESPFFVQVDLSIEVRVQRVEIIEGECCYIAQPKVFVKDILCSDSAVIGDKKTTTIYNCNKESKGNLLKIENNSAFSVCEMLVFSENIALYKPAYAYLIPLDDYLTIASVLNDGKISTCLSSRPVENGPRFHIDLQDSYLIHTITVYPSGTGSANSSINAYTSFDNPMYDWVNMNKTLCADELFQLQKKEPIIFTCKTIGRFLSIILISPRDKLTFCEIEMKGILISKLPKNIALNRPSLQYEGTYSDSRYASSTAFDGALGGNYITISHTSGRKGLHWLAVALIHTYTVSSIGIQYRICCVERNGEDIVVAEEYEDKTWVENEPTCINSTAPSFENIKPLEYRLHPCKVPNPVGKFVKLLNMKGKAFQVGEVEVFGNLRNLAPYLIEIENMTLVSTSMSNEQKKFMNLIKVFDGNSQVAVKNSYAHPCTVISRYQDEELWIGVEFSVVYYLLEVTVVPTFFDNNSLLL
ncbi:DgyrCDS4150 [Dimorphilus gyrociliatus]|uniref:DgyrCDS4150 n=1 Tax=Dimorphilus gyrociliatus TaxID=2664684 RepID=A0A7I8VHK1_9ANNE|nr:DgyrCDS4150 [Dimorphilus gyrociliatus]